MQTNEFAPVADDKRRAWPRWLIGFFLYNLPLVWPLGFYGVIRQRHHDMPAWLAVAMLLSVGGWAIGIRMLLHVMASEGGATDLKGPQV